jgi:hypothetical protein
MRTAHERYLIKYSCAGVSLARALVPCNNSPYLILIQYGVLSSVFGASQTVASSSSTGAGVMSLDDALDPYIAAPLVETAAKQLCQTPQIQSRLPSSFCSCLSRFE